MQVQDLYRDVILDHNRSPRNFRRIDPASRTAQGLNPLCGDKLTLYLSLDGERIEDVAFEGSGCAISVASASLLTEAVKGRSREEARRLAGRMRELLTSDTASGEDLGKLAALSGVRQFPSRVKCASLAWHALSAALEEQDNPVSTE